MDRETEHGCPPGGTHQRLPSVGAGEQLGQVAERPVPVELAVRGAGQVLGKRFAYDLWFRGELIDLVKTAGGHGFGVLRGKNARIDVYLAPRFMPNCELPSTGSLVVVRGRLQIWERGGRFQITACGPLLPTDLTGARAEAKSAAERQLKAEGVLDRPSRPLPPFPTRIAVVTSDGSAAMRDVHASIRRRAPWVSRSLHSCVVQGSSAAASIVAALDSADASRADLILLTRGGGAPDAFDPFDDPVVVRRVATSKLPIIVAVGHEGDSTLADRAADFAASTPTAAAEAAVPDGQVVRREVFEHRRRLHAAVRAVCSVARARCTQLREATHREGRQRLRLERERVRRVAPGRLSAALFGLLRSERKRLDFAHTNVRRLTTVLIREGRRSASALAPDLLVTHGEAAIRTDRRRLEELHRSIQALSPEQVLARGYALVLDGQGRAVRSSEQLRPGDVIQIFLPDGSIAAVVAAPTINR